MTVRIHDRIGLLVGVILAVVLALLIYLDRAHVDERVDVLENSNLDLAERAAAGEIRALILEAQIEAMGVEPAITVDEELAPIIVETTGPRGERGERGEDGRTPPCFFTLTQCDDPDPDDADPDDPEIQQDEVQDLEVDDAELDDPDPDDPEVQNEEVQDQEVQDEEIQDEDMAPAFIDVGPFTISIRNQDFTFHLRCTDADGDLGYDTCVPTT